MSDTRNLLIKYLKLIKKIRSLLFNNISRDFLIFLFFVFISFCFWVLQTLNSIYETEVSIPLVIKNLPKDIVITSDIPQNIKVTVKDKGTVLINYFVGKYFTPLTFDFDEYQNKGNGIIVHSSVFTKDISNQLMQSSKVLSIRPDTFDLIYTKAKARKLPIRMRGNIVPNRKYYISDITFSPDSVLVYAPLPILDTLSAVYIEPVNFHNIDATNKYNVRIAPIKGVKITSLYTNMTLGIDMYAEKSLEVPVYGIGFPKGKRLRAFPSKVTVTFQVGLNNFKTIKPSDFLIVVPYEEVIDNKNDKCDVVLKSCPKYINHARINPKEVDFLIEEESSTK